MVLFLIHTVPNQENKKKKKKKKNGLIKIILVGITICALRIVLPSQGRIYIWDFWAAAQGLVNIKGPQPGA